MLEKYSSTVLFLGAKLLYESVCPSLSHSLSQSVTKIFLSSLYHPIKRSETLFDFIQNVCMLQSSSMNMFVTHSVSQSLTIFVFKERLQTLLDYSWFVCVKATI